VQRFDCRERYPSDERLVDDGNPQAVARLVEGYLFRRPRMQSGLGRPQDRCANKRLESWKPVRAAAIAPML
jgi:hypothetical protein